MIYFNKSLNPLHWMTQILKGYRIVLSRHFNKTKVPSWKQRVEMLCGNSEKQFTKKAGALSLYLLPLSRWLGCGSPASPLSRHFPIYSMQTSLIPVLIAGFSLSSHNLESVNTVILKVDSYLD